VGKNCEGNLSSTDRFNRISESGLCIGCGLCEGIAGRKRIQMKVTEQGYERPVVVGELGDTLVDQIYDTCPGTRVEGLPQNLVEADTRCDKVWGYYRQIIHLHASDPVCITFYFTVTGVIVSTLGIAIFGWHTPPPRDWIFLIAVGLFGGIAQYLMTVSYRHARIGIVAPLKYLSIVIGGVFAYFIWGEIPDLQSFIGIAIIVTSGLYTLHREILLSKRKNL